MLCRKTCHSKARAQYSDLQAAACVVKYCPSHLAAQQPKQLWPLFSPAPSLPHRQSQRKPQLLALGEQQDTVKTKAMLKFQFHSNAT